MKAAEFKATKAATETKRVSTAEAVNTVLTNDGYPKTVKIGCHMVYVTSKEDEEAAMNLITSYIPEGTAVTEETQERAVTRIYETSVTAQAAYEAGVSEVRDISVDDREFVVGDGAAIRVGSDNIIDVRDVDDLDLKDKIREAEYDDDDEDDYDYDEDEAA